MLIFWTRSTRSSTVDDVFITLTAWEWSTVLKSMSFTCNQWQHLFFIDLILSQRSPSICGVDYYVWGRFSTPSYLSIWIRSHRILQRPQSNFKGAHFCRFSGVSFFLVLVHCHLSSPAKRAYSSSKSEMGFYVCAVWCVHRHWTSCFMSHPRKLGNV